MNPVEELFNRKKKNILSVYFTAGYPNLDNTMEILHSLQENGVDLVELGIPFSDPLADGPVIQRSSEIALRNGMNLDLLFEQTKDLRKKINIPVLLMGYLNPVLQYGPEKFLQKASSKGFNGLILPDLPLREYESGYRKLFEKYGMKNIFLITPQTSEERVKKIDALSGSFIYMVSSASTTGIKSIFTNGQEDYFKRFQSYKLKNPLLAGFGISNRQTFELACNYANGAIIGSAFIKVLEKGNNIENSVKDFIHEIRGIVPVKI